MRMIRDDWNDGVDDNGGTPRTVKKSWLTISWQFPAQAPNPATFTVVAYTGSNPDAAEAYLFEPVKVPGDQRRLVVAISPNTSVSGINAAVRTDYA